MKIFVRFIIGFVAVSILHSRAEIALRSINLSVVERFENWPSSYELIQDLFRQSGMRNGRRKRQCTPGNCYWRRVEEKWNCKADAQQGCFEDQSCRNADECLKTCQDKIEWSSECKGPVHHRGYQEGHYPDVNDKITKHCFPVVSRPCSVISKTTWKPETEEITTTFVPETPTSGTAPTTPKAQKEQKDHTGRRYLVGTLILLLVIFSIILFGGVAFIIVQKRKKRSDVAPEASVMVSKKSLLSNTTVTFVNPPSLTTATPDELIKRYAAMAEQTKMADPKAAPQVETPKVAGAEAAKTVKGPPKTAVEAAKSVKETPKTATAETPKTLPGTVGTTPKAPAAAPPSPGSVSGSTATPGTGSTPTVSKVSKSVTPATVSKTVAPAAKASAIVKQAKK